MAIKLIMSVISENHMNATKIMIVAALERVSSFLTLITLYSLLTTGSSHISPLDNCYEVKDGVLIPSKYWWKPLDEK